jgi:hypothetical protein
MNDWSEKKPGWLRRIRVSLARRLAPPVPDEVSCCEFDCRKTECVQGDWERCCIRIDYASRLRDEQGPDREGA